MISNILIEKQKKKIRIEEAKKRAKEKEEQEKKELQERIALLEEQLRQQREDE